MKGSFVDYWDPKHGTYTAHVLEVHPENRLKIRVHRCAQPDYDVDNAPYSERPLKGHWTHRRIGPQR